MSDLQVVALNRSPGLAAQPQAVRSLDSKETIIPANSDEHEIDTRSHSQSSSLWTAPSPSQQLASSSPTLPHHLRNSRLERGVQLFSTPPQHQRTDSSAYYTALWGPSSAQEPSPEARRGTSPSRNLDIAEPYGGSPLPPTKNGKGKASALQSGKSGLQASSYAFRTLGRALAGANSDRQPRKPRFGFTQDWLKDNLVHQSRSEKGNWWSDDEGGSDSGSNKNGKASEEAEIGDSWLKPVDTKPPVEEIPTMDPTTSVESPLSGHETSKAVASVSGKPLPPPPLDRSTSEAPIQTSNATSSEPSSSPRRPLTLSSASFQKTKKKVMWRQKPCVISLPLEDESERASLCLKPDQVENRMKKWEEQGYVTYGFSLGSDNVASDGQSRKIYPDLADWKSETEKCKYRVSIPDRRAWDEYVNRLKEEKLRALGVSFGDEEPVSQSATPAYMSRQASSQNPAFSTSSSVGPFPTISTSAPNQVLSPPFTGSAKSTSQTASIASPDPVRADNIGGPHFSKRPNHVPPTDQTVGSPYQHSFHQFTPSSTGTQSQHYFGPQNGSRGGSQGVSPAPQVHLPIAMSPAASMLPNRVHEMSPPEENLLAQMRQQQLQLQAQLHHQQHQQQMQLNPRQIPVSMVSSTRESELQPTRYISQPEIATPVPLGHRQNLSETLQKEIDQAEQHLEESIRRQLANTEGRPSQQIKKQVNADEMLPAETENIHDMDLNGDISDLNTNPSVSSTPEPAKPGQNTARPIHASKPSLSKLNVNAQEFKYEPRAAIAPSMFAFSGNAPMAITSSLGPSTQFHEAAARQFPKSAVASSNLNVSAPAFTPGVLRNTQREFSFSSSAPISKTSTVVSQPRNIGSAVASGSDQSGTDSPQPKIFGNINFAEMVQPLKRSKAVPIVKPRSPPKNLDREVDCQEDEAGRITQADGRQKRLRRTGGDGDQVPLFASPHPSDMSKSQAQAAEESTSTPRSFVDRETVVSPLERATDQLKEIVDDLSASDASSLAGDLSYNENRKPWEPFEFRDVSDAAVFDASRPRSTSPDPLRSSRNANRLGQQPTKNRGTLDSPFQMPEPDVFLDMRDSSLSATAKPFEFNPGAKAFDNFEPVRTESKPAATRGGLAESRYAPNHFSPAAPLDSPDHARLHSSQYGIAGQRENVSLESDGVDGVSYVEPSYTEIDAVMKHLNQEDSDFGVERDEYPLQNPEPVQTLEREPQQPRLPPDHQRSDAPSPSPQRSQQQIYQYLPQEDFGSSASADAELVARNARFSPSFKPRKESPNLDHSPIHRLNSPDDIPISDWDDVVSSVDDSKLQARSGFFDHRVNDLIGSIVQDRLGPLEKSLDIIHNSLTRLAPRSESRRNRRSVSVEIENSDADDEDDQEGSSPSRVKSPLKDRKLDRLKSSLLDAISSQKSSSSADQTPQIMEALAGLKESIQKAPLAATEASNDIRQIVEDAVAKQMRERGQSDPVRSSHQAATADKYQLQIAGLESMLKIAETRAEDELRARRSTEDDLADAQRMLRHAELEAAEQRESAEETERSLHAFHDERQHIIRRSAVLEDAQAALEKTASDLSAKNVAMEGTLEEYRLSSSQWRQEIDDEKRENVHLKKTIDALKAEFEESIRGRQSLRAKFDRLQEDMTVAARDIARDQSTWRHRDEEHKARQDLLGERLEAEARTREKLKLEIERLETQEKEAVKARFNVETTQRENARLLAIVDQLRAESHGHQDAATCHERELHDVREVGRLEIHRLRTAMEIDLDTANKQVEVVRSDLESVIARLQSQVEDLRTDATSTRARHGLMLEEASESKKNALREAAEAREAALQEHYRFHERTLDESRSQHEHALRNAMEETRLLKAHFKDQSALFEDKSKHYQDRIDHLEERLEISKSAAQAAVQAVQSAKVSNVASSSKEPALFSKDSQIPEKVSPQALRESILVLQEQLQDREGRIEQLEQELSKVDKDAPTKIKDRDMEISWLRELLGVRIDDLQDIITALSQPSYNQDAVKDAVIRLKASLQMEQQEKERAMAGGRNFPSLSSLPNLAASPRALPLAAAAAWGNWRKGRDTSFGSLSEMINGSPSQTPSKSTTSRASPSQSFLSGLMTPPSTNLRQTPQPLNANSVSRPSSSNRPLAGYATPRRSLSRQQDGEPIDQQVPPTTPPLMRKASYDQDAESNHYSLEGYAEDDDSTAGGTSEPTKATEDDQPFGPMIGT